MNSKTRVKLIVSGFAVLTLAFCVIAIRLTNLSLTAAGARRLPCADADYVWVNSNEVITFETRQGTLPNPPSSQYDNNFRVAVSAERANIFSGARTALSEFNSQFPAQEPNDIYRWRVSPDAKQLLFSVKSPGSDYEERTAPLSVWSFGASSAEPVDPEIYAGIDYDLDSLVWMPDNKRLIIGHHNNEDTAALYNTESLEDATVAFPIHGSPVTALGVTSDNRLICTDFSDQLTTKISILEQGIYPSTAPERKFTPKLPDNAIVKEISLSPKGDKLAWTISIIHTSPIYRFVKKLAPPLAAKLAPKPVIAIYLSQLDGKEMRLVGMEDNPPNAPSEQVQNVRWRPDGKYISYRWRHGVYMVQVE